MPFEVVRLIADNQSNVHTYRAAGERDNVSLRISSGHIDVTINGVDLSYVRHLQELLDQIRALSGDTLTQREPSSEALNKALKEPGYWRIRLATASNVWRVEWSLPDAQGRHKTYVAMYRDQEAAVTKAKHLNDSKTSPDDLDVYSDV